MKPHGALKNERGKKGGSILFYVYYFTFTKKICM